ncbi:hypothetical protein SARC_00749 [Sphaeroforma arctica JP610]|uniref:Uncharacterized protein n=1 Tax=Sphaeroforma arctica JP610 TaxID=667725 RepID=A0A0L0GE25_9EUKA|nr:hypothetical protein SARC_00749 [Sphaeroforma arctica JP610]KNC87126.1 hypothetical protein SARC_00749 [Sphaeroforma arctica JP610]|eukprot:XP_014161028.1 hypothetical protein SARC_00749 [Sphaeroforma arctica JP610]
MIRWSQDDLTPLPALPVGWPTVRSSNNPRNTIFPSNDAPLSQSNVMSADTQQAPKERKWGRKVHRLVIRAKYSLLSFRRSLVLLCGVVCVVCVVSVMTATATDHPMIWRKRHAVALDTTQLWHHLHGIPSGYTRTGFVGHRSADVDSVCAAVAMAHLFGMCEFINPVKRMVGNRWMSL